VKGNNTAGLWKEKGGMKNSENLYKMTKIPKYFFVDVKRLTIGENITGGMGELKCANKPVSEINQVFRVSNESSNP
jgi:hypothetical protein